MSDIDIASIKKKSFSGIAALFSRTLFLQLVAFGATFLLTIFLSPAIFGVFYVVSAVISFLGYFSDVGLAAALIQKKDDLTREDLVTTFTIQQFLVGLVSIISFLLSGRIADFYRLDSAGVYLLQALIISFFLSSLKTIPSVLLERRLEFHKLVIPNILETIGFYLVAVILAWRGFGISSFTAGVLVRAVVGLVAVYSIEPWRVGMGISKRVATRLLRFGVPFQINSFLALIKDDLLTVFLGKVLPFTEVGYIGWAKKWAEVPLRLVMDSVVRVAFPAFSRLQQDMTLLGRAIERTLFGLSVTIYPLTVVIATLVRPMIDVIPRYHKWEPALLSFYLFALSSVLACLSTPLTNALNAIGKIKITLWLMVLWTSLTWVVTVLFIRLFGFHGVSAALLFIASTLVIVVALVKRIVPFSFWRSIRVPTIGVCIMGLFPLAGRVVFGNGFVWNLLAITMGGILYIVFVWRFERNTLQVIIRDMQILLPWKQSR